MILIHIWKILWYRFFFIITIQYFLGVRNDTIPPPWMVLIHANHCYELLKVSINWSGALNVSNSEMCLHTSSYSSSPFFYKSRVASGSSLDIFELLFIYHCKCCAHYRTVQDKSIPMQLNLVCKVMFISLRFKTKIVSYKGLQAKNNNNNNNKKKTIK